jgi:hypothetical protein
MQTECNTKKVEFQKHNRKEVTGSFDGGAISSDAGGLLLREVNMRTRIIEQAAACFKDSRNQNSVEHTVAELVGQRVYGLALGYEDLNDHDRLRHDPAMALLAGKKDPTGESRQRNRDKGKALAGPATLNRLELTAARVAGNERYKKIAFDEEEGMLLFTNLFLQANDNAAPSVLILDLDATDDPIHGNQEGRFFHGYYGCYCYLPLYIFCGESLLWAQLRTSNIDGSLGSVDALKQIVGLLRRKWPDVMLIVRGDSGFCREDLMTWCDARDVDYILGMSKNSRLNRIVAKEMKKAKRRYAQTGLANRVYRDFSYRTLKSWSRKRRVVGKAEYLPGKENQRFVVTSLSSAAAPARTLYEELYCARGDMENRIKEQQLDMFADRTSAETMRANQIRLWFSSLAYCLVQALRAIALKGTAMEKAQCHTIRVKLFKIGARINVTARKIWIHYSKAWPGQCLLKRIMKNLAAYDTFAI